MQTAECGAVQCRADPDGGSDAADSRGPKGEQGADAARGKALNQSSLLLDLASSFYV